MTTLHDDYFVLAMLSELQVNCKKNQPNFNCNNLNKNIFYSSPFFYLFAETFLDHINHQNH